MNKIICADALKALKRMDSGSVHTIITSPPYYGLRDYGVDGQIGLEQTPEEYIDKLVEIFHELVFTLQRVVVHKTAYSYLCAQMRSLG